MKNRFTDEKLFNYKERGTTTLNYEMEVMYMKKTAMIIGGIVLAFVLFFSISFIVVRSKTNSNKTIGTDQKVAEVAATPTVSNPIAEAPKEIKPTEVPVIEIAEVTKAPEPTDASAEITIRN